MLLMKISKITASHSYFLLILKSQFKKSRLVYFTLITMLTAINSIVVVDSGSVIFMATMSAILL